jgi:peptide/nickel transport system ATP-binding protein
MSVHVVDEESGSGREAAVSEDRLLLIDGLTVAFPRLRGHLLSANRVRFGVQAGRTLGLVGESGCGKSVTLRAIIGMVPKPGEIVDGGIFWRGRDLTRANAKELRRVRGREIAMIFQDPSASLTPVRTVGDQLIEVLRMNVGVRKEVAEKRAITLLERVGIPSARVRMREYSHHLSGGMRQRVMIALAIACEPSLLLADEPTTALDVTIQNQILALLLELQRESGMAIIIVSHDLGVIAETCDEIAVMYAGHVVEHGTRDAVLHAPRHPYTRGLLASVPSLHDIGASTRRTTIPGQPPDLARLPAGCPFAPRCAFAGEGCSDVDMALDRDVSEHSSACPFVEGENQS